MRYRKLNESSFSEALEKAFGKNCDIYDEDGGRFWYIEPRFEGKYSFEQMIIGPLDDDPSEIRDFRDLIAIKQYITYRTRYEKSVIEDLRSDVEYYAKALKKRCAEVS